MRLVLMPITAHPFDMFVWYTDAKSVLANGPLYLQGFPPLWYHYLMGSSSLQLRLALCSCAAGNHRYVFFALSAGLLSCLTQLQ